MATTDDPAEYRLTRLAREYRGEPLERVGAVVLRYGLVLVLIWIGALKFTAYEAQGVHLYASTSPLLMWISQRMTVRGFSMLLGVVEITLAALIAIRPISPKASALGSLGSSLMYLTTLSFLLTTPGVVQSGYAFPALAGMPGQFLLKDVVLLGAALWTAGEALHASSTDEDGHVRSARSTSPHTSRHSSSPPGV